ncbi:hypothetical protein BpHYR1_032401 [Brachionus plicatilis]|uniref:Uncharacterized protein n=1 Tax=Brachionus plicatilis TaxID=10195 RepID=A0A3M7Q125_BRAPC|nr:hypothetical protein BpHYR1_032401 [Brachionus plicatilis]
MKIFEENSPAIQNGSASFILADEQIKYRNISLTYATFGLFHSSLLNQKNATGNQIRVFT